MVNQKMYIKLNSNFETKSYKNFFLCISNAKKENIILLKNPKLIYILNPYAINADKSLSNIHKNFSRTEEKSLNVNFINTNKIDRKYKNNLRQENPSDDRKNKGKLKKKVRNKINLDQDKYEVLINSNSNRILAQDVLNRSIDKSLKINKQKKKYKSKQDVLDDTLNNNDVNIKQEIIIHSPLTIQDLADKLIIPEAEIITGLFLKGISVTINQVIDVSLAIQIAKSYNFKVIDKLSENIGNQGDDKKNNGSQSTKRAPVITILGHVDHGKTTLLDAIRKSNLTAKEVGRITQAIAGYEVDCIFNFSHQKLVFLDTPGHEAFTSMRLLCSQVTDIAILVVAADDGLRPQTIEAIHHIQKRNIPMIVVINKIDKVNSNAEKIMQDLTQYNIVCKNLGGDISSLEISALKGYNIGNLLSEICILSDVQNLKSDPNILAEGKVLEAHVDKTKGIIANLLIQNGTLYVGDLIFANNIYGRVKAIINNSKHKVHYAQPSSIVEILAFSELPLSGSNFKVLKNEKEAKQIINQYNISLNSIHNNVNNLLNARVKLDSSNNIQETKSLNLIIKADTQGSIEALIYSFAQIPQDKVQINILSANSNNISDTDLNFALTSQSLIVGFNINIPNNLYHTAKKLHITLKTFNIIYELLDYIKLSMFNLIDQEYEKVLIGSALVKSIFTINKGLVAGCLVKSGKLKSQSFLRVYRNNILVYDGTLDSLKHLKDDVDEVSIGNECGIMCNDYKLWQKQDLIEAYELVEKLKEL